MTLVNKLSRRERQIMDIVYELNEASAKGIEAKMPDAPSYSAIRAMLSKLEVKGFMAHRTEEMKYVYYPTIAHEEARDSAMNRLLKTFFNGSASQAMTTLLDMSREEVTEEDLEQLQGMIDQARKDKQQ